MPKMQLEPTATAQWQTLVQTAASTCGARLKESVEAYLVFMLMRFLHRRDVGCRALAIRFLEGLQAGGAGTNPETLRDTGDECLLVCGLFPQRIRRRTVPFRYYVDLGRGAYGTLASNGAANDAEPFDALSSEFIALMEILHAMRGEGIGAFVSPLEAAEIARDTGSRHAWNQLTPSKATLVMDGGDHKPRH